MQNEMLEVLIKICEKFGSSNSFVAGRADPTKVEKIEHTISLETYEKDGQILFKNFKVEITACYGFDVKIWDVTDEPKERLDAEGYWERADFNAISPEPGYKWHRENGNIQERIRQLILDGRWEGPYPDDYCFEPDIGPGLNYAE